MKLSQIISQVSGSTKSSARMKFVVPVEPSPVKQIAKEDRFQMKLSSDPTDPTSQEYTIVTHAFDNGTPEE